MAQIKKLFDIFIDTMARFVFSAYMRKMLDPTYRSWQAMIQRCTNSNRMDYPRYGGRGILVSERWLHSFSNFLFDMGRRPDGMSIDRIDVNGNYSKNNCRWATPKQQAENTRKNINRSASSFKCKNCGCDILGKSHGGRCNSCDKYYRRNCVERPIMTHKEMIDRMRNKSGRRIGQVDIKTDIVIKEWNIIRDACRKYGMGVSECLRGKCKTAYGFKWIYI